MNGKPFYDYDFLSVLSRHSLDRFNDFPFQSIDRAREICFKLSTKNELLQSYNIKYNFNITVESLYKIYDILCDYEKEYYYRQNLIELTKVNL